MQVEKFGALFERFERSAFRIEVRDRYDVENERDEFVRAARESRPVGSLSRCVTHGGDKGSRLAGRLGEWFTPASG